MSIHMRRSMISCMVITTITGGGTACLGDPPSDLDETVAVTAMPSRIVDPGGAVWEKVGVAKISDLKIETHRQPLSDDPNAKLSLRDFAARGRPIMETGGVEYQLSWTDTLALAESMRRAPEVGHADGSGPDGGLLGGPDDLEGGDIRAQLIGIVGAESRTQVFSSAFPWTNIGSYAGPAGTGTVIKMINHHTAITAGDCMKDGGNIWLARGSITFAAGTSGALVTVPSGCYDRTTLSDSGTNPADDFAIIRLHSSTANCALNTYNVGFLGWETHPACTGGLGLNTPGYPSKFPPFGAPPPGTWVEPSMFTEFNTNGHIDCVVNQNVLWFDNDISPGESGGPAYRFDGTQRYVNGIMTRAHDGGSNEALRLDSRVINFFNSNAGF